MQKKYSDFFEFLRCNLFEVASCSQLVLPTLKERKAPPIGRISPMNTRTDKDNNETMNMKLRKNYLRKILLFTTINYIYNFMTMQNFHIKSKKSDTSSISRFLASW